MPKPKLGLKKNTGKAGTSLFGGVDLDSVWPKSKGPKGAKVQAYVRERYRQDG